jgi:hypothetical protein
VWCFAPPPGLAAPARQAFYQKLAFSTDDAEKKNEIIYFFIFWQAFYQKLGFSADDAENIKKK